MQSTLIALGLVSRQVLLIYHSTTLHAVLPESYGSHSECIVDLVRNVTLNWGIFVGLVQIDIFVSKIFVASIQVTHSLSYVVDQGSIEKSCVVNTSPCLAIPFPFMVQLQLRMCMISQGVMLHY